MMDAEITKEPTKLAAEYVASYRFMHAVSMINPEKAVAAAMNTKNGKAHTTGPVDTLKSVKESFKKFCKPVVEPPQDPHANRRSMGF